MCVLVIKFILERSSAFGTHWTKDHLACKTETCTIWKILLNQHENGFYLFSHIIIEKLLPTVIFFCTNYCF